jgi:hypothetical protein
MADEYRTTLDNGGMWRSIVHEPDTELFVDWHPTSTRTGPSRPTPGCR